jgi:hypothetical protein
MTTGATPWPGVAAPPSVARRRRVVLGVLAVVVVVAAAGTILGLPDGSADDRSPGAAPGPVSTDSTDATDPTEPTEPTDPTDPTDPTEPTEPTDPTDPTEPTEPTDSTDPPDSTDPTDPADSVVGWEPGTLYVALYGHPGSSTLGVLGEQDVDQAVERAEEVAAPYASLGRPVVPTFELITTVASSEPGSDDDYSNEFPDAKFQPWIDAALENEMHVIVDLQSGRSTFPSQAREIEGLLAQPNVSLALDPEWRVGPTDTPEGGRIGSVDGAEVNETIDYLDEVIRRFELPPKMLVVHQFTPGMVTNKEIIRGTPNVHVVFQMDGFGTLPLKISSWDVMVADLPAGASTGWKNFYDEDSPTPTPAESVAVKPTPIYISYQ